MSWPLSGKTNNKGMNEQTTKGRADWIKLMSYINVDKLHTILQSFVKEINEVFRVKILTSKEQNNVPLKVIESLAETDHKSCINLPPPLTL